MWESVKNAASLGDSGISALNSKFSSELGSHESKRPGHEVRQSATLKVGWKILGGKQFCLWKVTSAVVLDSGEGEKEKEEEKDWTWVERVSFGQPEILGSCWPRKK